MDTLKGRWRRPGWPGDIDSLKHACRGLVRAVRHERPVQIQLAIAAVITAVGVHRRLSRPEWSVVAVAIGSVVTAEIHNAAVEQLCDRVDPNFDPVIGRVKDASAGAVLMSALGAIAAGAILFGRRR